MLSNYLTRVLLPVVSLLFTVAVLHPSLSLAAITGSYDNSGAGPSGEEGVGQLSDEALTPPGEPNDEIENKKGDDPCNIEEPIKKSDSEDCKTLKRNNQSGQTMEDFYESVNQAEQKGIDTNTEETMKAIQSGEISPGQVIDTDGNVHTIQEYTGPSRSLDGLLNGPGVTEPTNLPGGTGQSGAQGSVGGSIDIGNGNNVNTTPTYSSPAGSGFLPGHLKQDAQYGRATEINYKNLFEATGGKVDDWAKAGKLDQKIAIEAGLTGLAQGANIDQLKMNPINPSDIDKYGFINPSYDTGVDIDPSLLTNSSKYNSAAFGKMLDKHIAPDLFSGDKNHRANVAMSYYVNVTERYTPEQAAGIVGNMSHESNLEYLRDAGGSENSTGLAQWNAARAAGQRRQSLESFADQKFTGFYRKGGKEYWTDGPGPLTQLAYADAEMQGTSPLKDAGAIKTGKAFANNPNMSASEAATFFQNNFERPRDRTATLKGRQNDANAFLASFNDINGTPGGQLNTARPTNNQSTAQTSTGGGGGVNIPKTGIPAIDKVVDQATSLLNGGGSGILSQLNGLNNSLQTIQNLFKPLADLLGGGSGSGGGGNNNPLPDQPYTDLNDTIQVDLKVAATLSQASSTHNYVFFGNMDRVLKSTDLVLGGVDNYQGATLKNKLMLDLYCDSNLDKEKEFTTPYAAFAQNNNSVVISENITVTEPGSHCFAFSIDIHNSLPETDEDNNLSNWQDFIVEFIPAATSTNNLPAISFEVLKYDETGTTTDWSAEDLTITRDEQIAFRWSAPLYDTCSPFISPVGDVDVVDIKSNTGNTIEDNIDIHEHTGYYELTCELDNATSTRSIRITIDSDVTE